MNLLKYVLFAVLIPLFLGSCKQKSSETDILTVVDRALDVSIQQSLLMVDALNKRPGELPKTTNEQGELETCQPSWWVSGFFTGQLWYLYEFTNDTSLKVAAEAMTARVENQQFNASTHDVGFIIYCSYGNGYRITHRPDYLQVIQNAARTLSTRYNPRIGSIRSWDSAPWSSQWQFPVIIDNMMNLELLSFASIEFSIPEYRKMIDSHAQNSMNHHYRDDFSCFHVVSYDTLSGEVEKRQTSQGLNDQSAWARGQAWGLYGFTMMFRETGNTDFLNHAIQIADFLIHHPSMPEDQIPYWDFDDPLIPNTYRDASAAAIMCSALIELSSFVEKKKSDEYMKVAERQIRTLASDEYLAKPGTNGNFILKHGVGHRPNGTEVDRPLSYADYYFVEALLRFKKAKQK